MAGKPFALIGAALFVAAVPTLTALQLREAPAPPLAEISRFAPREDDRLAAQLGACAALGEAALTAPACRAAWAAQRRRFLGGKAGDGAGAALPPVDDLGGGEGD